MTNDTTALPDRRRGRAIVERALPLLLVACVPLVLAFVNDEWVFTPAGEQDPWWFVGFGYHYGDPAFHPDYYKSSRLPWILAEFVARRLLQPAPAAYTLTLGFLVFGAIGFYLAARRLFGSGAALAGTVLLSTYTQFMVSRASDYHNTPAGPFYLWSFLLATMGAVPGRRSRWWLFLSGVFFGLSVHSSMGFLLLAPSLLIHLWFLRRTAQGPPVWLSAVLGAAGVLAVTIALGLVNLGVGRKFLFVLPQVKYTLELATPNGQEYLGRFYKEELLSRVFGAQPWLLGARHLALPVAAALAALVGLVAAAARALQGGGSVSSPQVFTVSACLQMAVASAIFLAQETRHGLGLVIDFMGYPLIFPAFLAVSSGFVRVLGPGGLSAASSLLIVLAGGAGLVCSRWLLAAIGPWLLPSWPAVAPLLFYGGAALAFALLPRARWTRGVGVVLVALFGVGHAFTISQWNGLLNAGHVGLRVPRVHYRKDAHLAIVDLHARLSNAGLERAHLWWDESEPIYPPDGSGRPGRMADIGMSTTRTAVQGLYDTEPAPAIAQLPDDYLRELTEEKGLVAVMTRSPDTVDLMLARLRQFGDWRLIRAEDVAHGEVRFRLFWLGCNAT